MASYGLSNLECRIPVLSLDVAGDIPVSDLRCPFCGETDFDEYGLKAHLIRGWCDAFEGITEADCLMPVSTLNDEAGFMPASQPSTPNDG